MRTMGWFRALGAPPVTPAARLGGLLAGVIGTAVVTAALIPFRDSISSATPALVFVIPVVGAGVIGRRMAAVATALLAAGIFSYAFVPPYDHLSIAHAEDVAAMVVFIVVAVVVGTLVAIEADRRNAAEHRAEEIRRLYDHNQQLLVERERLRDEAARVDLMERIAEHRSALLRSVSHDLRTPLATIRAVASDLRDGTAYPPETRDRLLDLVGDEAERLNRIVENLLNLTRIEAGALEPDRQAVAIDELIVDRVGKLGRLFLHARIEVDVDPQLPLMNVDYTQLDQVISNLLENAARHAPPASCVRVRAAVAADEMLIEVEDEGDGVGTDEVEHIFEPFRRGRGSTSSGVGLAICKAIVESHGGTISVSAGADGRGARFRVGLPMHDAVVDA